MPAFPELTEPLTDGVLAIRLAAERDIPEVLIAYQDDPELDLRLGQERAPTGADLGSRAEQAEAARAAGTSISFTILEAGSDVCRGQINVHRVDWDNDWAELGVWLAPQVRGRGYGRRALRLTAGWLLRKTPLERIQVLTEPNNEAMIGAAAGAGFTYEGVLRSYVRERGQRTDIAILSLVSGDLER